jgi:dephospho-CoA kinase
MYGRPDGTLDRAALGRLVFSDSAALRDLEASVHPAVRPRIEAAVVIEAIKLVEAGYGDECDEVWLVTCDPDAQRQRLVGRGLPAEDADQRIAAQADPAARLAPRATRIIDTSADEETTRRRVAEAWAAAMDQARD